MASLHAKKDSDTKLAAGFNGYHKNKAKSNQMILLCKNCTVTAGPSQLCLSPTRRG